MNNLNRLFNGKNILVTGGTGSIGSQIVKELLKYNVNEIIVFSRDEIKQLMMKKRINDKRIKYVVGDIRDYNRLERIFTEHKIDIIYHTAALKHVVVCEENPIEAVKTNIIGTKNIVDLAKKYNIDKLINVSTDKAVNPTNVMGATKFIAERIVLNANYTAVRFGNVVGTRGSVIPVLLEEMIRKKQITITDPNVTRFLMRVEDAVRLILRATQYGKGGEIFVFKMKAFRLSDLAEVLINHIAPRLGISNTYIKINIVGLFPGEKLHEELISTFELPYLHKIDNELYVITPKSPKAKKSNVDLPISSDKAELISKDTLVEIIEEYIEHNLQEMHQV